MNKNERDFVGSLEKGLSVIEAFDTSNQKMTLSEVARKTGLTRAAARRYLLTLTKLNYAEHDKGLFSLAPRVLRLGYAYVSTASLPRIAQPVLETVGGTTKEVASIAVFDGTDIVFLARSMNHRIISATIGLGTPYPAYCTAIGRVLLASRPDAEVEQYLKSIKPKRLTPKTKTERHQLLEEIVKVRKNGFAIIDEELEIGLCSIAVPVSDARGIVRLGMSVSMHAGRMTVEQMIKKILPSLESGRKTLSSMLY
jgi:IclR family transcriptional regulator, pca regulon regulatory protein